jgi:hypothetical protein
MGHSSHPSASSSPPRALQQLRRPHRPPRRLPRPVVHLYCRCSPPLTHATVDGLTGEHPSSSLPPNGSATLLCRSSHHPQPTPLLGITENRPAPPPVAMELPPLSLFDHAPPAHAWPASLVGPVKPRIGTDPTGLENARSFDEATFASILDQGKHLSIGFHFITFTLCHDCALKYRSLMKP